MHAVPIHIFLCPVRIDVVAVLHIEAAVIVPGIVDTIFSGTAIVPCQCIKHFFVSSLHKYQKPGGKAAHPADFSGRKYPVLSGAAPLNWAMAAALDLLRRFALNPIRTSRPEPRQGPAAPCIPRTKGSALCTPAAES